MPGLVEPAAVTIGTETLARLDAAGGRRDAAAGGGRRTGPCSCARATASSPSPSPCPAERRARVYSFQEDDYQWPQDFVTDIKTLRERARKHIENGAVTEGYKADRETVVKLLNEALATEIVCVLRYKRHYFMAQGIHAQAVAAEFLEHANEEQGHADQIAARIVQLQGEPNLNPEGLTTRSHSEYEEGGTLVDMIKEDLVAERIAIDSYAEMARYFGDNDPTTAAHDRRHPGHGGRARRRPGQPARDAGPLKKG